MTFAQLAVEDYFNVAFLQSEIEQLRDSSAIILPAKIDSVTRTVMQLEQQSLKGIIAGDQIRLLEPTGLEDGTLVELTITVPSASEQARERQRLLLRQGLHLGGPPYPDRDQLHER